MLLKDQEEEFKTLPAKLDILEEDEEAETSEVRVTIHEGKFHQVKRMFEAVGKKVMYLKQERMHTLELDEHLPLGEYRRLTDEELASLKYKKTAVFSTLKEEKVLHNRQLNIIGHSNQ